ncbi:MarC family protein [Motilimonas pumila]|uniref:UPF0056 membrane protein n=1 Tax=Motilimonas pumila TaxID=2303987 RepID=A0A418YFJ4_9GAMM|nr:MarC family protein [Motilimonas pumila]RJG48152.1 MarC family protein [Motilimonas pumila]
MNEFLVHGATVFMGFFAIMNPIANAPIFLGLTAGLDHKSKRQVALRSVFVALVLIAIFSVAGKMVFELFGISLPAFRVTGGILVALIGFHMLHGESSKVQQDNCDEQGTNLSIAISPLAMPILAGPGTIATAMSFSAHGGVSEMLLTIGAFALLCIVTYFAFIFGERLVSLLGESLMNMITKLMGLILAVIGIQMLIDGLIGAFPILAKGVG